MIICMKSMMVRQVFVFGLVLVKFDLTFIIFVVVLFANCIIGEFV
jgi:hypothetical protein